MANVPARFAARTPFLTSTRFREGLVRTSHQLRISKYYCFEYRSNITLNIEVLLSRVQTAQKAPRSASQHSNRHYRPESPRPLSFQPCRLPSRGSCRLLSRGSCRLSSRGFLSVVEPGVPVGCRADAPRRLDEPTSPGCRTSQQAPVVGQAGESHTLPSRLRSSSLRSCGAHPSHDLARGRRREGGDTRASARRKGRKG